MSRDVEITVLLPLELGVAGRLMKAIDAAWPGARLQEPGGRDSIVFIVDADVEPDYPDATDDDAPAHTEACSADDCPCFLSGEQSALAAMTERSGDIVDAATRLVELLSGRETAP